MKKLIVIAIVVAMMFSLSITALADDPPPPPGCIWGAYYYGTVDEVAVWTDDAGIAAAGLIIDIDFRPGGFASGYGSMEEVFWGDWIQSVFPYVNVSAFYSNSGVPAGLIDFVENAQYGTTPLTPHVDFMLQVGEITVTNADGTPFTGTSLWVSFVDSSLSPHDTVNIAQFLFDGIYNHWSFISQAEFRYGQWWFEVADFGLFSMFMALIERGYTPAQAAAVLGATSPATGDSTLSMVVIALVALSALGLATFSVAKARKEMI